MDKLSIRYMVLVTVISLIFSPFSTTVFAEDLSKEGDIAAGKMIVDAIMVRPLGLVSTALGTTMFVLSFPFSALGGNVKNAGKKMVVEPAKFTFLRPLGDF